ncbi:MAG: DUF58 domain-containing protein [Myxococcota bacterium]
MPVPRPRGGVSTDDLGRAARLLVVRSRREARGLFAGNYVSAFRGGGLEFDESRPYVPSDDVRTIDWNATARHGETFVKRFREERDQSLSFALDVSASMRFGSVGNDKAGTAAHALALLAAAAAHAGDRVGLVAFDERVRALLPPARGVVHGWRMVHTALACAAAAGGGTRLAAGLRPLRALRRRRGVVVLFSDFRGDALAEARDDLAELARRHDLVAAVPVDPREFALPRVGPVRIADPEAPERSFLLDTGSRRARRRYLAACAERRRRLVAALRRTGADPVWLRTDQNPLYALGRFFNERAGRRRRPAA